MNLDSNFFCFVLKSNEERVLTILRKAIRRKRTKISRSTKLLFANKSKIGNWYLPSEHSVTIV